MCDICLDNHELQTLSRPWCWDGRWTGNYPLSGVAKLWGWQSQHLPVATIRDLKRCLPHSLMRPEILSATLNPIIWHSLNVKTKLFSWIIRFYLLCIRSVDEHPLGQRCTGLSLHRILNHNSQTFQSDQVGDTQVLIIRKCKMELLWWVKAIL